jgi:ABC-2 type transport system permease protein
MTVQTHTEINQDLILAARQGLLPARGKGWLTGFGNMLSKELGEWFHTRRWLKQLLIWVFIINGYVTLMAVLLPARIAATPSMKDSLAALLMGFPPETLGFIEYFTIVMLAGIPGVIILAQDEVIQEKQLGTAAWILSKPASRPAFIMTKVLSNIIGILVFIIAMPGCVTMVENYLVKSWLPPLVPLLSGAGVLLLGLFFYLSLVIMLGVLFESRGAVMGIAFGVMFIGVLFPNFIPQIAYALPVKMETVAAMVMTGMPLPSIFVSEVISTAVLGIVFILVALWRFQRKEF